MQDGLQLFPQQASTLAPHVDWIFFFLCAITAFFATAICLTIVYFMIRYHKSEKVDRANPVLSNLTLELIWTGIPLAIVMVIFVWGAVLYYHQNTPRAGSMEIYVIAKQWMWKLVQPNGKREINELHVPLGRPVKLTMTSEDVIHDFFVPAFRTKKDVLPGRYTSLWFEATQAGTYHFFCSQYCGTGHSRMIGKVIVLLPAEYERWLSGGAASEPPEVTGERLFTKLACATCHKADATGRGPSLVGLVGTEVKLSNGVTIVADEDYIRQSIMEPNAKITAGYQPIMPTFGGQLGEEAVLQLIAYIKSQGKKTK